MDGRFILFGSRRRGDFKADSDWDILYIPSKPIVFPKDYIWYKVSFELWNTIPTTELIKEARKHFNIPETDDVDLFVLYWKNEKPHAALMRLGWDELLEGWLLPDALHKISEYVPELIPILRG